MVAHSVPSPFPMAWLQALDALEEAWQGGDQLTQDQLDAALTLWRQRLQRPHTPDEEWFDIVDSQGNPLGLTAPRWFAHLVGLRHRVVHVLFTTPQGFLVLQMRAHTKLEWPNRLDTSVGGHLKAGQDWEAGVLTEIQEEIGLAPGDIHRWSAEARLIPVGTAFERYGQDPTTPPYRNRQVNRLYTGTLTAWGLAHVHFADGEVDGLYLTRPEEVARMQKEQPERLAPGLRRMFPRWQAFTRASAPPRSHSSPAESNPSPG